MNLDYLVGVPGAGKSTLVEAVTAGVPRKAATLASVPVVVYDGGMVELGRRRDSFSGTDALSMSIQPKAINLLTILAGADAAWHRLFGEGDRLANLNFLLAAREAGWHVTLLHLDVPEEVAAERRRERGSKQTETWLKGRRTKVARLVTNARAVGFDVRTIDGTPQVSDIAATLDAPVLRPRV